MAKSKKSTQSDISISSKWQTAFVVVALLGGAVPLVSMLFWNIGNYVGVGTWAFQLSYGLLPILFFIAAAIYAWPKYKTTLHKLFATTLLAFVGFGGFNIVSTLESAIRYRFFPPVITDVRDDSLLTAFGHDWAVMGLGFVVFVLVLIWLKLRQKA